MTVESIGIVLVHVVFWLVRRFFAGNSCVYSGSRFFVELCSIYVLDPNFSESKFIFRLTSFAGIEDNLLGFTY